MKKIISFFHIQGGCGGSTTNAKKLYEELSNNKSLKVTFLNCSITPLENALGEWIKNVEKLKDALLKNDFDIAIIDLPAPDNQTTEMIQYAISMSDVMVNNIFMSNRCFLRCHEEVIARWLKEMNQFIDTEKCIGTVIELSRREDLAIVERFIEQAMSTHDMIFALKNISFN